MDSNVSGNRNKNPAESSFWTAPPQTPPLPIRIALLAAYLYAFYLGFLCFLNPFVFPSTPTAEQEKAIVDFQFAICFLPFIYFIDAAMAASPLHWCCMRGIPPKNVIQHHVPFVLGMLPTACLSIFATEEFRLCMLTLPAGCTYMATGCLTSINEALWVGSSFFRESWLDHKTYRVGQKLMALLALSQFIALGSISSAMSCYGIVRELAVTGEHAAVRICMLVPPLAFFLVVPYVQIPLLKGAFTRFLEALRRPSNGAIRNALGLHGWMGMQGWTKEE